MVHAVSATFKRFERMSPPAAGMALALHVLLAILLWWSAPIHAHKEMPTDAITVTMEAPPPPPPPPEKKPAPEPPKPVQQAKPAPQAALPPPGLAPRGAIGPKNMYPKLDPGQPTEAPPPQAEPPPQQAMARPAEPPPPPPPPPPPTLEQELPPVEAPPAPVTSRDIPRIAPPVPERKPEPSRPPQQQAQPPRPAPQQLQSSPLSRLSRNAPSQQHQSEPPRSTFVNPSDAYAMNTAAESYQYRIVDQVARYRTELAGAQPNDNVVVRFTIARNGRLLGIAVVRSSGKPAIDRGLITAFQQVAPFPPLPPEISGDSATFTLTFGPRFQQR